jgi:hypothetical protein
MFVGSTVARRPNDADRSNPIQPRQITFLLTECQCEIRVIEGNQE